MNSCIQKVSVELFLVHYINVYFEILSLFAIIRTMNMEDKQKEIPKIVPESPKYIRFQERPQFLDESVTEDETEGVRRMPSTRERESMDSNISKLGKLFEGSDVKWQLDGALNISLMSDDYIGVHKDVDLSIEDSDLEKLEHQLSQNNYGLFLSTEHPTDSEKRQMEHVSAQKFREAPETHLMIAAVDEQGKIKEGEKLNFIDVHLVRRDEKGNPLGYAEIKLPSKWYEPQPKSYQGSNINLSHPAKVAYFKIHGTRPFDSTDLKLLAGVGNITTEDVDDIGEVFEQEFIQRRQASDAILNRIAANINTESSPDDIYKAFINEPMVAKRLERDKNMGEIIKELSIRISETDKTPEQVKRISMQIFDVERSFDVERKKVATLRKWIEESEKMKELRHDLGLKV